MQHALDAAEIARMDARTGGRSSGSALVLCSSRGGRRSSHSLFGSLPLRFVARRLIELLLWRRRSPCFFCFVMQIRLALHDLTRLIDQTAAAAAAAAAFLILAVAFSRLRASATA
jgi:hypothetical protein